MDAAREKIINNFLNSLLKLIRYFKLYPPNHPYIATMVEEADKAKIEILSIISPLKMAMMGGVVFVGKDPLDNPTPMIKTLIKMLKNIKIASFEIKKSATSEELQALAMLCSKDKEELVLDGGKGEFNSEILKDYTMPNITVNEIEVKFGGEEDVVTDLMNVLGVDGAINMLGDQTVSNVEVSEDKVLSMVDAILSRAKIPGGATDSTKSKRSFEEIGDMLSSQCENIGDLKTNLLKTVFRMDPSVQKDIFGESYGNEEDIEMDKMLLNLSIKSRANIVRNQLKNKNMTIDDLKATLDEVVEEKSEVVDLAEMITKEFDLTSASAEEKRENISRLFNLLQEDQATPKKPAGRETVKKVSRGLILIAEDDMETAKIYQRSLHPAGFETLVYTDGQDAVEGIKEHRPHMIVLDLKLPSLHGLDIIYFLRKNRDFRVPVIICTAFSEFQNEFEIKSYPKLEFFTKPIDKDKFMEAIEKLAPPPPEEKEEEKVATPEDAEKSAAQIQLEEDMEKARGVQAKLLPDSIPDLVGFDIGTFYCSCKEVGGDYFDIIPIDNNNTGILIADVSGKGVSGAMVMVMVRSIMKMVAPNHLSPKKTIIEINGMISRDIKMGMFVSVLYMVLNEKERKLTLCCAGHNPAVIWEKKNMNASYMKPSGMALGITNSSVFQNSLKEEIIELNPSDLICIYTDGVVEAMSPQYEEYGEPKLAEIISTNINKSCEEIIDLIYESIREHEDTAPRHDDISIIALKAI